MPKKAKVVPFFIVITNDGYKRDHGHRFDPPIEAKSRPYTRPKEEEVVRRFASATCTGYDSEQGAYKMRGKNVEGDKGTFVFLVKFRRKDSFNEVSHDHLHLVVSALCGT